MVAVIKGQKVQVFADKNVLFQFAAADFRERAQAAVNQKNIFTVLLSGGNTPKLFFDTLALLKNDIPWSQIQFFFGDERYVPKDNAENNYHTAYTHLFSKVPINLNNIFPMPTELKDASAVAKQYAETLRQVTVTLDGMPQFDLCYLGLGDNAHTASLMPQTDVVQYYAEHAVDDNDSLVKSLFVPALKQYRLTLTPPVINESASIIFLVTGADKAQAVWEVLEGPTNKVNYPAQLIQAVSGNTMWYLDRAAALRLTSIGSV